MKVTAIIVNPEKILFLDKNGEVIHEISIEEEKLDTRAKIREAIEKAAKKLTLDKNLDLKKVLEAI